MRNQPTLPFTDAELYDDRWEYLLVASPARNLAFRVREIKEEFYKDYQQKVAVNTQPHITIANFRAKEGLEASLIRLMRQACNGHPLFVAELWGFGGFKHSTLYINVLEHEPFRNLAYDLRGINDLLRRNGCPRAHLVYTPHMTIARGLPYHIYEEAIEEYADRRFRDFFVVNELVLLKRRHRQDKCRWLTTLRLAPLLN